MEERYIKKGLGAFLEEQNELTLKKRSQSAGAPWWLVIVLVLGLLGLACYIAWTNSASPDNRKGFLSFFLGPRTSDTQIVVPDSSAIWEDSLLNANTLDADSSAQTWQNNAEGTTGTTDAVTVLTEVPPPSPSFDAPISKAVPKSVDAPISKTPISEAVPESVQPGYYIKAGEFKSRSSALYRVSELRQGNYSAKIIEPDSPGGTFVVTAGEFTSYTKARAQARTIGFILDIRTSVVKKE